MGFYIGNIYIGNKNDECPMILGPMAGVCDMPYRILCAENGADLVYTEMVSAKGILYNNKNTKDLLRISPDERPVALQLFGSDPAILADMAKKIEHLDYDILDINMGCPVPKIVNNGEGSALMKNPKLIGEIVKAVSNATTKPVTVKIRKGCDKEFLETIMNANIKRIVYVSCDPKSLVRDLDVLRSKYDIKKVSLVDMFGNTTHVETVVSLELNL